MSVFDIWPQVHEDAESFIENYCDDIEYQLVENGKVSDDLYNDYRNGDAFIHENFTDKYYCLPEAAEILDKLAEYEETDNGLWQGLSPRDAISAQAAYTYTNAVVATIIEKIKAINAVYQNCEGTDEEKASQAVNSVLKCAIRLIILLLII